MPTTLEKIQRLEQYLANDSSKADPVLDSTIDKLLARERSKMLGLKVRLEEQCEVFETKYAQSSAGFYADYENGKMGDEMDYIEWASTIEMLTKLENRLALLEG